MKHPSVECPERLKPILREVLGALKEQMASAYYSAQKRPMYICHQLLNMRQKSKEPDVWDRLEEAEKFIKDCLDSSGRFTNFACWLIDNDPDYADIGWEAEADYENQRRLAWEADYENQRRLAWLEWLTKEAV